MNPLCKVCGDVAAGFHFGVFTCEGCKSFFGRAYNKSQTIPECKKKSKCVINKNTRTTCKACRLTKCIQVGMSKGGSKFGRRSNWFKIKFLLEEQQKEQSVKAHNESIDTLAQAAALHSKSFQSIGRPADEPTNDSRMASFPFQLDPTHDQANPFYSAALQYPMHSTLLHKALKDLSNLYLNQQKLLQQHHHHSNDISMHSEMSEENDEPIDPPAKQHAADRRALSSPTSSSVSSSASSTSLLNLPAADKQEYPMDLSLKSRSPVDFSISGLLKINAP